MMSSKVRIACKRCRTKRIKCDGGMPACGHCQKANEPCIDVDGRNNTLSIPRDFAANAQARIEWLESRLKTASPDFNLNDGPRVDFSFLEAAQFTTQPSSSSPDSRGLVQPVPKPSLETSMPPGKRVHSTIVDSHAQEPFADEARSVALDLGLLTLNSDSGQMHYLGTSSGRLFTKLIGAGSSEASVGSRNSGTTNAAPLPGPVKLGPFAHAKRFKESCRLLFDTLRKTLPSEEEARVLLDVYLRNIHIDYPFLHPASLLSVFEALYQCAAADTTAQICHNGWVESVQPFAYNGEFELSRNSYRTPISVFTGAFHAYMVLTLAATVQTRRRNYDFAPGQFYRVAISVSQHCFGKTSIVSLQCTLLLAVYSLLSPAELNIWTLTYVAMAHCVDLGLHRATSGDRNISDPAIIVRKMVFFTVYHLDRSIAAIQGRPLGIRDETFDLELPTLEDINKDVAGIRDQFHASELSLLGGLTFTVHRFKLDPIISEIKLFFYHLPSQVKAYAWPEDHQSSQAAIREKLDKWRGDLSAIAASLKHDSEDDELENRRYSLKLTSQYFAAMILLYQPSQAIPQPSEQSLLLCYQCAASRLNTYNDLYNAEGCYQSWGSVQGIFASGATMISCLWMSDLVRNTVPIATAMRDLRTCTNLLSVGGEWWPSVKKGKESFSRAMDALSQKLGSIQQRGQRDNDSTQDGRAAIRCGPRDAVPQRQAASVFSGMAVEVENAHETHSIFQDERADTLRYANVSTNFGMADWTILEDRTFPPGSHDFPVTFLDVNQEAPDPTVEAFIAEFLNNNRAWSAF